MLLLLLFRLLDLIRMAFFLNFGSIWDLALGTHELAILCSAVAEILR
jgi:hypothetical protein